MKQKELIAYFSMEIALESDIPTYSGGLGVLAGDTLRSAADLEIPMVAVTLCYNAGYFYQMIDSQGNQIERDIRWEFSTEFERLPQTVTIIVKGEKIKIGAWLYHVVGKTGHTIPVLLLDTDVQGNKDWQRNYTKVLYAATQHQRIVQEMILGMGGVKMLRSCGYENIETFHMNEGHASFLTFELLKEFKGDIKKVKDHCIFTTHTPVPAGHDVFDYGLVMEIFREQLPKNIKEIAGKDSVNMSHIALNMSRYVNAVSRKHGDVSRQMFPKYKIDYITNGVHSYFWTSPYIREVFNRTFPDWKYKPEKLEDSEALSSTSLWRAHQKAKKELMEYEKSHSWVLLDDKLLTIGFARRITGYKRPTLIFHDLERLANACKGKVQFVFAGKTHPRDGEGKGFIKYINDVSERLWDDHRLRVVFLENYDMDLAKLMVSGVDVWLNNPIRYLEASGTSGMKALHNGVPNFSILDGWWIEGYEKNPNAGWAIGPAPGEKGANINDNATEAQRIYSVIEKDILPLYYNYRSGWIEKMKNAIKLAATYSTHRMVEEYATKAWGLEKQPRWRQSL